ncbi:MAG: serine--tRNA ligase [Myxococcales bacterium]|nr:serine--tRNA ligase [Myxococcales bacterium]
MLDFRDVGADLEGYRAKLSRRPGFDDAVLDAVTALWTRRSDAIGRTQRLQEEKNTQGKAMKVLFQKGTDEEKAQARVAQRELSQAIKDADAEVLAVEGELVSLMLEIPNVPHPSVPEGDGEDDNKEVRQWGTKPSFTFTPKDHVTLGEGLGMLDFERAAKLAGARFVVEYDDLARMERALAAFMLDTHVREHGYREVAVPYLVNSTALTGTGQLPKFEEDQFRVPFSEATDYWLVPTAEVPVTNLYHDQILGPEDPSLPHAYCAHTPCFRKEAGSAGRDTRGLIRLHQFNKVELVRFEHPDRSYQALDELVDHAENILKKLELHYRVMLLCTGDISSNAAKCYDLEVWLPGQNRYREISSCSNFEAFQARRAKIRFKEEKKGKPRLLHTLNGSGLAIGRTLVALLEQHQLADGSIRIPKVLRPYMGGTEVVNSRL